MFASAPHKKPQSATKHRHFVRETTRIAPSVPYDFALWARSGENLLSRSAPALPLPSSSSCYLSWCLPQCSLTSAAVLLHCGRCRQDLACLHWPSLLRSNSSSPSSSRPNTPRDQVRCDQDRARVSQLALLFLYRVGS